jgi:hypothetical protein
MAEGSQKSESAMNEPLTVDASLVVGLGEPVLGQMCVVAAVCYALGLLRRRSPPNSERLATLCSVRYLARLAWSRHSAEDHAL